MSDLNRRATDTAAHAAFNIDQLIAAEADESKRVLLLVMNSMKQSLDANTRLTHALSESMERYATDFKEHKEEFNEHTEKQEEIINKGKGARVVILWVAGVVQAIGLSAWFNINGDMNEIRHDLNSNSAYHASNTQRDDEQDRRIAKLEEKNK